MERLPFVGPRFFSRVVERSAGALASGALVPIHTDATHLDSDGLCFSVRILARLDAKDAARIAPADSPDRREGAGAAPRAGAGAAASAVPNPFLPYDDELYVCDVPPAHVCLLNKFNVVENHVLIVTRAFAEQCTLLEAGDLGALWACLGAHASLGFYNAGEQAGASQRHKHLQMVPLPLAADGAVTPFDAWIEQALARESVAVSPHLPFAHALCSTRDLPAGDGAAGEELRRRYHELLRCCGIDLRGGRAADAGEGNRARQPYNLLLTRAWMMVVPRSCESFAGVSINALAHAGSLLVRDRAALDELAEAGVLAVLREVGMPPAA